MSIQEHPRTHLGSALVDLLIAHRVDTIYGVPGGQTEALYDAVANRRGAIRHVAVRDERTAAYAADAHARLIGRVGVCDATVGPGTAKLPSGLGEALNSSVPVLAIVSELPTTTAARRYRGATSQALDQEALLAPVTKWVATVRRGEDLAPLVRRAFREMTTGRPGPVALIVPMDVFDAPPPEVVPDPQAARFSVFPSVRAAPDSEDVDAIASLIERAQRPAVILGGGARIAGVGEAAARLAAHAAVATTLSGKGILDERHPMALGVLGNLGTPAAGAAAAEADLLVLVGTKLGSAVSLGWSLPRPEQKVAVIDVDPVELGRDFPVDAILLADAKLGLEAVADALEGRDGGSGRAAWAGRVGDLVADWHAQRDAERGSDEAPIAPQRVMGELERVVTQGDVLVADASLSSGWIGSYVEVGPKGPRTLFPRGLAGLGWAVPAAIGAAVASPASRVVAVMGDGAAAYAVGEFATIVHEGLDVKLVVLNNRSLGWIRWYRRVAYGRGWQEPDAPDTDFAAIANAYRVPGVRLTAADEVWPALRELLERPGPGLVEIVSATWQTPIAAHREAVEASGAAGYG